MSRKVHAPLYRLVPKSFTPADEAKEGKVFTPKEDPMKKALSTFSFVRSNDDSGFSFFPLRKITQSEK